MSTDAAWEQWGRQDPYFGVITDEKFRSNNLDETAKAEFFESGKWHAHYIWTTCQKFFDPHFAPKLVLDFGCGVGRLLITFAALADQVVGLDVSPSMLREAQRNCDAKRIKNVALAMSDDELSAVKESVSSGPGFDLVHSAIVFQHIPPERGQHIFAKLLDCLAPGGMGAIQLTYAKTAHAKTWGQAPPSPSPAIPLPLTSKEPQLPEGDPEMQMNAYNLNHVLFTLQRAGITRFHSDFTDHGGELGVFLFFQKPEATSTSADKPA